MLYRALSVQRILLRCDAHTITLLSIKSLNLSAIRISRLLSVVYFVYVLINRRIVGLSLVLTLTLILVLIQ
jgi:hypothetical protein